jgi:phosphopentomutase
MAELSPGKDSTSGHWEIAGLVLDRAFPTYPHGFPPEVIGAFEQAIGRKVLGNCAVSGTEIIERLGKIHMDTGRPIVYTSADSVFQIAAHEEVIPVTQLYWLCTVARELLTGAHSVARVIARPFVGRPGAFSRTERRRDFSLPPPAPTLLDAVGSAGYPVVGLGKIEDLFAGRGISEAVHTRDNRDGVNQLLLAMRRVPRGLLFLNLVEFDMNWGHRNDCEGFARGLAEFDGRIPEIRGEMRERDMLIITADHGCDPTTASTDHSREYVPLLVAGRSLNRGVDLGLRRSFADIAATIGEIFDLRDRLAGTSFLKEIRS